MDDSSTASGTPDSASGSADSQHHSDSHHNINAAGKARRRPHHKSRFGCKNCKARRVKCDENKPECNNCSHRRLRCDFATTPAPTTSSRTLRAGSITTPHEASPVSNNLGVPEIELMYHWTTSTAKTLATQDSAAMFWQTSVTEIGFTHHHVLHLIFAVTALHLAYCRPTRHAEYTAIADQHCAEALPVVTSELSHLSLHNCDAVLLSVQLLSLVGFARGPQPGEFLAFGVHRRSEWLTMFRGIRTTMESLGYDCFAKSINPQISAKGRTLQPLTRPPFEQPLADLRDYVQRVSPSAHLASNLYALDTLLEFYQNRYNRIDSEYSLVFGWLFRMEDEFLEAMQRHESVPLVLCSYFAVLLNDMENVWFMKGWTTHVLGGIWGAIRDEDKGELGWPIQAVGWIPP